MILAVASMQPTPYRRGMLWRAQRLQQPLRSAVARVGPMVKDVRDHLRHRS
jgi:hypothetical protein